MPKEELKLRKLPRLHSLSENSERGEEEEEEAPGGSLGQPGREGVLTISHAVSPVSLHAEILERSGQLTATVDPGLGGGEQAAEQRGKGQQHDPRRAHLPSGSPAPGFHAQPPPRWLTAGFWDGRQLDSPGRPVTEGYPL